MCRYCAIIVPQPQRIDIVGARVAELSMEMTTAEDERGGGGR